MSEVERLSQKLDAYIEKNELYHKERDEEYKAMAQKIDDIHAVFTATGLVGKAIKWVATFIIAVGSAYLLVKEMLVDK